MPKNRVTGRADEYNRTARGARGALASRASETAFADCGEERAIGEKATGHRRGGAMALRPAGERRPPASPWGRGPPGSSTAQFRHSSQGGACDEKARRSKRPSPSARLWLKKAVVFMMGFSFHRLICSQTSILEQFQTDTAMPVAGDPSVNGKGFQKNEGRSNLALGDSGSDDLSWQYPPSISREKLSCVPASLLLFGVPKEFARIWKNYLRYIVLRNRHIQFEVHMHMYSDLTNFSNAKNKEDSIIEGAQEIQTILKRGIDAAKDEWDITVPTRLVSSRQKDFDETGLRWLQPNDTKAVLLSLETLKNVFRQGNSIKEAFASATDNPFFGSDASTAVALGARTYMFLRSDTLLVGPVDVPCAGLPSAEVRVPTWQQLNFPGEYNDRTALAGSVAARKYARAKSDAFREFIVDLRNRPGEERLRWLPERIKKLPGRGNKLKNPEKMLKLHLDREDDGVKLRVRKMDPKWAQLVRVRAGGRMEDARRWGIEKEYLSETNLRR